MIEPIPTLSTPWLDFIQSVVSILLGYADRIRETYRHNAEVIVQLGPHLEEGDVGVSVVEAVDVNPLHLDRITTIPDPVIMILTIQK